VQQGWSSINTLAMLGGSGPGTWLPPASIVPGSMLQLSMFTDLRAFLMPSFVQSFKLASDRKIEMRKMLALISVVILIGLGMGIWMNVRLGYEYGGLQLNSWFAQSSVSNASPPALVVHCNSTAGSRRAARSCPRNIPIRSSKPRNRLAGAIGSGWESV
jgi:hypothetical protein